ncbi:unnamed protein product [Trifolium pratense]|uniref:Uncharacterized protein n=1 Tax=Trifolium pratense TaxID=57577 RepID=A0ACB0LRC5_TRIPR|nr:unnamed protein product [Trifolium pratense]
MARNLFVLALIFVAVVGVAMAAEAPSSSPKSSPSSPKSSAPSPKSSTPATASPKSSPKSSPAPPTSSESPAASPSDDDEDINLDAPVPGPSEEFGEEEPSVADDEPTSGASSLKVSAVVVAVAAGFFAF